jgi:hypothetical protein
MSQSISNSDFSLAFLTPTVWRCCIFLRERERERESEKRILIIQNFIYQEVTNFCLAFYLCF